MRSILIEQARRELMETNRRMAPAMRLKAFAESSRLMQRLHQAGLHHRSKKKTVSKK